MRDSFRREYTSARSADQVLADLLDVERVASWVPILSDLREEERLARYRGVLEDRLGPFRLRADLQIDVRVEAQRITLHAAGQDRQVGSRLVVDGTLETLPGDEPGACRVIVDGSYEVSGKAAQLGASSIRRKATHLVDVFGDNLRRETLDAAA